MKYCTKCGAEVHEDAVICVKCGCEISRMSNGSTVHHYGDPSTGTYNVSQYDDTPRATNPNSPAKVIIKVLLILTILGIIFGGVSTIISGLGYAEAIKQGGPEMEAMIQDLIAENPEFAEVFDQIDYEQVAELIKTICIVSGIVSLIPLLWVLPMRKKIVNAIKEGTTLSTGFKICTLLFVNLIAGIILLCLSDL